MTDIKPHTKKIIAVTGIGVVTPYGIGMASLYEGLLAGKSCLVPAKNIFPNFEGTTATVSTLGDLNNSPDFRHSRSDRLAMVAAEDAVAELDRQQSWFRESGVVMASTVGGLSEIDPTIMQNPSAWYRQKQGLARARTYAVGHVATSVGKHFALEGPCCAVSVACASGGMAIALAANMLLDGEAPMVLAGGSDALCPFTLSGFNALQSLDKEPCRPFDQHRKGLNIGEGAAVLVLETLDAAVARGAKVLGTLRGWAMTNDATHPTAPQKQGLGMADCINRAMQMAQASADDIGFVNAHGTGTPLNDIAEANAYDIVFRERSRPIPVSSTKSYFGHCLGSAGAIEAAITLASIQSETIFPTLRLTNPIPSASVDWVRDTVRHQPVGMGMSVSLGFGGSNAVLIFGSAPA